MIKGVLIFILGLISVTTWATPSAQLYLNPYYPQHAQQEQVELLDASLQKDFRQFAERRERTQKIWTEYAPVETRLVEKDSFVLRRIMDRSTARILKSDFFRRSRLGKTANYVKESMEADMEFTDEKNVSHYFDFKLALFQGQAFIQYSGYTKAQLRYDVSQQQLAVVFQHDLSASSSIGIESSLLGENQVQMVNLNYFW